MSFVGTRPEVTKYVKKYTKEMRANFQISYEKVENELRYIDDKIFYGAFGIEISAGKVARKSITL